MSQRAFIVGWSHYALRQAGHVPDVERYHHGLSQALDHAGVAPKDVDFVTVGVFNNGLTPQGFEGGLVSLGDAWLAIHAGGSCRERLCHRQRSAAHRDGFHRERTRSNRARDRGGEDDRHSVSAGACGLAERLLSKGRREPTGLCRDLRTNRRRVFQASWRSPRRAGDDRSQEPRQWRKQSVRARAQGARRGVLQYGFRAQSAGGGAAAQNRLLDGVRRCGCAGRRRRGNGRNNGSGDPVSAREPTSTTCCRCRAATRSRSRVRAWLGTKHEPKPA